MQERKPFPWKRLIITTTALIFLALSVLVLLLSTEHIINYSWYSVAAALFVVLGPTFTLLQWLFPFHPIEFKRRINSSPISSKQNAVFHFNEPLIDPGEFYGRTRERITLLERTRKGASTSIIGPRRIGKSWLLDYLKLVAPNELGSSYHIASLDGTMPKCNTVHDFTVKVLDAFGIPYIFSSNRNRMDLEAFEKFVKDLKSKQITPVLCIDEFEGLFSQSGFDCTFYASLRYIAQNDGLVLITVSKNPLIDLVGEHCQTSGFFNIFETLALKPFSKEEAEEFAQAKSKQAGFTKDETMAVLEYGQEKKGQHGWPPLRLQLAGKMLLEDKNLASGGKSHFYQPADLSYWREFQERLEEKYRGAVR